MQIDPGNNPAYTSFAVKDSISGQFINVTTKRLQSPGVTVDSTWAFGTHAAWNGAAGDTIQVEPSTNYCFRAYAKDGNTNE